MFNRVDNAVRPPTTIRQYPAAAGYTVAVLFSVARTVVAANLCETDDEYERPHLQCSSDIKAESVRCEQNTSTEQRFGSSCCASSVSG